MTKTRLKKTISRQTSIIIIGLGVLAFALAYFSREPLPSSAFFATSGTQPTATTTPQTAPSTARKTQAKPQIDILTVAKKILIETAHLLEGDASVQRRSGTDRKH